MTVARARGDKGACDRLASELVRMRGGCQYPGCTARGTDTAHIIGRTYAATRTRLDNLLCLCRTHHVLIDRFPDEKLGVCQTVYGDGHYLSLREAAESTVGQRFDWSAEAARLRTIRDRITRG